MVEDWIASRARPLVQVPAALPGEPGTVAQEIFPLLRGAWGDTLASATGQQDSPMPVFDLRCNDEVMEFFARTDWGELAGRGVATPDHVIRTKGRPLIVDARPKPAVNKRWLRLYLHMLRTIRSTLPQRCNAIWMVSRCLTLYHAWLGLRMLGL